MRFGLRVEQALSIVLFAIVALGFARVARAEGGTMSAYERRTADEAAARLHEKRIDPLAAEGKLIERVEVVILDVFDEHDPVPDFVNAVHTMTREYVVRQELLFHIGEQFSLARADETARNLRKLRQLSLVLVVPVSGSAPDRVRLIVITRDVWSLRINIDVEGAAGPAGTAVTGLSINPTEENFLGTHTTVGGLFTLDPGSYSIGAIAKQRRVLGTDLEYDVNANVIYNRASGEPEGSFGSFAYGAPLRTTDARWGWGTGVYFLNEVARRFDQGRVQRFDAEVTNADDALPIEYHRERQIGGFEVVRSYGRGSRYDFSLGVEADRRYARYAHHPGAEPRAERELVATWLPVSDTRVSPFVQLRTHEERYEHTINLDTLALQEDFRLGPEILLRAYPASTAVASTRDLVGLKSGVSYTLPLGDGLARGVATNVVEYEFQGRHDASLEARARVATPTLGFGRFVVDGVLRDRYENFLNRRFQLGGDGRLRGYAPSGFRGSFIGPHVVAINTEFRTGSVDILSAEVGLAAFHDAGHAADRFSDLSLKQSAGIGFRALFPQVNRTVFRVDWGFPLSPGYPAFPGGVFLSFGQAFPTPELDTPTVMLPDLE